ncbi:peroxisome assembly protein 26 [Stigmatopora nigra]
MSIPAMSEDFTAVFHPPMSTTQIKLFDMLEESTEQLMLFQDFHASFKLCERGLEILSHEEKEDVRGELKAGFCIVGIQALAELNQWPGVLTWILQSYEHQENIPAKMMLMCILLYSKVGEPKVMQEPTRAWLDSPSNRRLDQYRLVVELYLLHILLPLRLIDHAREIVTGEVGSAAAFTEAQRQLALTIIDDESGKTGQDDNGHDSLGMTKGGSTKGSLLQKVEALLKLSYRRLISASGSFPFHKLILAAIIVYILLLRLDPALPSSFMWISRLHQLLRQMWNVAVAPYSPTRKE